MAGSAGAVSTRYWTGRSRPGKEQTMNETSSAGLRLPVQGAVYRTRAHGPIADESRVEASAGLDDLWNLLNQPVVMDMAPPLTSLLTSI